MAQEQQASRPAAGTIDVRYVANLARLNLSESEVASFQEQLGQIVEYVNQIRAVDVDGVEPTAHAVAVQNVFRDDVVKPGLDREVVLSNAPEHSTDLFRVPKIVE